jgi:hypothetical protein
MLVGVGCWQVKVYELRFASASTASKTPEALTPPSKEPGWSINSWQVANVDVTIPKPAGPGMHAPATLGSTHVQILVLWEREVDAAPSDQAVAADPAD